MLARRSCVIEIDGRPRDVGPVAKNARASDECHSNNYVPEQSCCTYERHKLRARYRVAPTRTAPRITQPLLFPQFQSPLLDEVNRKVLSSRNKIDTWRILDPIHHHLHVVYLILLLLSRSWAAFLCSQVPLKLIYAITPPSAALVGTE